MSFQIRAKKEGRSGMSQESPIEIGKLETYVFDLVLERNYN
jgi:hypothetical protein